MGPGPPDPDRPDLSLVTLSGFEGTFFCFQPLETFSGQQEVSVVFKMSRDICAADIQTSGLSSFTCCRGHAGSGPVCWVYQFKSVTSAAAAAVSVWRSFCDVRLNHIKFFDD